MQLAWGARPPRAQRAAPSRPASSVRQAPPFGEGGESRVRREGAPNNSRGGCAPPTSRLHRYGFSLCDGVFPLPERPMDLDSLPKAIFAAVSTCILAWI